MEIVTEEEFDEAIGKYTVTAAQIREAYDRFNPDFPGRAISWDVGLISMVKDVGEYGKYYRGSYTIPNFHVHATLASAFDGTSEEVRSKRNLEYADFALLNATIVFLLVIREQNKIFGLNLDAEIDNCDREMCEVWRPTGAKNGAE